MIVLSGERVGYSVITIHFLSPDFQMSAALARAASGLISFARLPIDIQEADINVSDLSVGRLIK